jgi:hypothetical protein
MRKSFIITLSVLLLGCVALLIAQPRTASALLEWDYDYRHDSPCTSTKPKGCVRGFNVYVGDLNSGSTPTFVANRTSEKGQQVSKGISTKIALQKFGNVQFCVTAVGVDAAGAADESLPICVSKFVMPFTAQKIRFDGH